MTYFLESRRLALRALQPKDLDTMFDYRNNERCSKFQRGQKTGYEELKTWISCRGQDQLFQPSNHQMAIVDRATDEMVGEISFFFQNLTITLGYTISYRHHRRGYAFEILSELLPALHGQFPEHEVICLVEPENIASIGLLEKLKFDYLGYAPSITSKVFGKWAHPDDSGGLQ